jgi:hypothetical protein
MSLAQDLFDFAILYYSNGIYIICLKYTTITTTIYKYVIGKLHNIIKDIIHTSTIA